LVEKWKAVVECWPARRYYYVALQFKKMNEWMGKGK
jgi:hypothetical protein